MVGSYRIDGELASGGMGTVYRATHTILPRHAAIKVLHNEMMQTSTAVERMLQEARILEAINHPTAVKVYDAGLLPDGRPWVAMELIDGQTLADHMLVHGRIPPHEAARIVSLLADALARAHSAGIVHRDVKPENIMLVSGPRGLEVKLLDWGIAHMSALSKRLTAVDYSPGTPCYMSPEQLRGEPLDGRSDIYALGIVAFEMLTGALPFDGESPIDIAVKTLHSEVPSLTAIDPSISPHIDEMVHNMVAKKAAQRPTLDWVSTTFAAWSRSIGLPPEAAVSALADEDYADFSLEMETDSDDDYPEITTVADCASGEISC